MQPEEEAELLPSAASGKLVSTALLAGMCHMGNSQRLRICGAIIIVAVTCVGGVGTRVETRK